MWLSTLPRRFGIILEKILDRHERSGIAVQWNGGFTSESDIDIVSFVFFIKATLAIPKAILIIDKHSIS